MATRKRKNGVGGKKRVLLAGEYPLLPTGRLWFELVLVTGYEGVQHEDCGAIEAGLEEGLRTMSTPRVCPEGGRAEVLSREGAREDLRSHTARHVQLSLDSDPRWSQEEECAWDDTEPPAPPAEKEGTS